MEENNNLFLGEMVCHYSFNIMSLILYVRHLGITIKSDNMDPNIINKSRQCSIGPRILLDTMDPQNWILDDNNFYDALKEILSNQL